MLDQDSAAERDLEKLFAMLERIPKTFRAAYWIEAASFSAAARSDLESARAALEHIPVRQRRALKLSLDSVHAYMLRLEGEFEQAEKLGQSVFSRLKASHPDAAQLWYDKFVQRGLDVK